MISLSDLIENIPENLIDNVPVGIILFDKNGYIRFVNRAFHEFELLYPGIFTDSLLGKNVFIDNLIRNRSLENELSEIKEGYPFEIEIDQLHTRGKSNVRLYIKGTPNYELSEYSGGTLLIEDLRISGKAQKDHTLRNSFIEYAAQTFSDVMIVIDPNGLIKFISGDTSALLNETNNLTDLSIHDLFSGEYSEELNGLISQVKQGKKVVSGKIRIIRNDHENFFNVRLVPQYDKRENILFVYLCFTEIKLTENDLKAIKENVEDFEDYALIKKAAGQAIFSLDEQNKVLSWDKNCEIIFNHDSDIVKNKFIGSFIAGLDHHKLSEIREALQDQPQVKLSLIYKTDVEKVIECFFVNSLAHKKKMLVQCKDITSEIKNAEELNKTLEHFQLLLSNADFMISKVDENGNILDANAKFCEVLNYDIGSLKQKRIYELIDRHYFEKNIFDIHSAEIGLPLKAELPFKLQNGNSLTLSIIVVPEKVNETDFIYNCYLRNINEQRIMEKEVRLFLSMFNASNDGIVMGQDGKISFANRALADIFSYQSGDELTGKDILDLVSNDDSLKVAEYFRLLERKKDVPSRLDFLGKKKDGSVFHAEISASTFELEENSFIVMIVRDVSERIRAQRAIRESEEKYRNITENIDDFLFTFERLNSTLRPVFCTTSVQKITGYTQSDFLTDGKLFFKIIHPDDFQVFKPKLMNLLKSRIQNSGEFEFRIINKHGNIVWVRTKLNLVRIGAGRIQKIYGLVSDVTFRKRAEEELKKSTQNLIKLNETKDRFISIISHDLRTPFSSILGFTDLLINDKDLTEEEKKQYFRYIQDSSKSMLLLVNSLLDWTRLQTGRIKFEPQKIDVTQIVEDTINSISGVSLQKRVEIINLIRDERLVFADKSLLSQVFANLISNAIKFTNEGGKIYVSLTATNNPRFLEFSVKDTGVGIKPENLDKLFSIESKFTSDGTAGEKGSGLGLSLVREIVERHNGKIWVKSKFGEGSDFRFTLPIASAKILIVDDNKTDRLLYSKILKNITPDYEIDLASNGKEALEKIKSTHPALVITDHSMPVMNGYEFVLELQKLELKGKPPVIVLSSDIDRNAINDYNGIGIEYVFHKPVNLGHFKQAVEKSLRKSFTAN